MHNLEDNNNEYYGTINEIVPLNDDEAQFKHARDINSNSKTNIKKGFFAAIDNVFGGGQSSTAQIA